VRTRQGGVPDTHSQTDIDKPPFEVSETGQVPCHYYQLALIPILYSWGEFEIQIRIYFTPESGEKAMTLYHHLKLHPWTASGEPEIPPLDVAIKAGPVHSWQYDEVVFNDPYQIFLTTLTNHPPTPLPKTRRRPVPYNLANPASLEASKGGVPEFNLQMAQEEHDRLEEAKKAIIAENEKWKAKLAEKERELEALQKELAEV